MINLQKNTNPRKKKFKVSSDVSFCCPWDVTSINKTYTDPQFFVFLTLTESKQLLTEEQKCLIIPISVMREIQAIHLKKQRDSILRSRLHTLCRALHTASHSFHGCCSCQEQEVCPGKDEQRKGLRMGK